MVSQCGRTLITMFTYLLTGRKRRSLRQSDYITSFSRIREREGGGGGGQIRAGRKRRSVHIMTCFTESSHPSKRPLTDGMTDLGSSTRKSIAPPPPPHTHTKKKKHTRTKLTILRFIMQSAPSKLSLRSAVRPPCRVGSSV